LFAIHFIESLTSHHYNCDPFFVCIPNKLGEPIVDPLAAAVNRSFHSKINSRSHNRISKKLRLMNSIKQAAEPQRELVAKVPSELSTRLLSPATIETLGNLKVPSTLLQVVPLAEVETQKVAHGINKAEILAEYELYCKSIGH